MRAGPCQAHHNGLHKRIGDRGAAFRRWSVPVAQRGESMGAAERLKGQRRERQIVALHQDQGIPACKESRSGYTGHDVLIADQWWAEVKSRKTGGGFALIERWLEGVAFLFVWRDRRKPLVVMEYDIYVELMRGYLRERNDGEHTAGE